jgi:AhpD family alkylhydroperoxidase
MATATETQSLTARQKELVAVGASIGAGCHPCVSHHLKAGANAGLDGEQLLAAVSQAERVTAEAAVLMADHARSKLGPNVTIPAELSPLDEALAALGAALGANDASAIDLQMQTAHDFGASRSQLERAIEAAKTVQENASRIHVREAQRLLDSITTPPTAAETQSAASGGCGCASDEAEPASEAGEPSAETACGHDDAVASPMNSAPAGFKPPAAIMAHCREMFGRMFGTPEAPAEANESEAATAQTGCSDIQEV